MSQSREKLRRRVDKLEVDMKQLRQAQIDSNHFSTCLHTIREQTGQRAAAKHRMLKRYQRNQRIAWLVIIAMVLCAVLCLIKVKTNADELFSEPAVITDKLSEPAGPAQCWEAPDIPELTALIPLDSDVLVDYGDADSYHCTSKAT